MMELSKDGINLLKSLEGVRYKSYQDSGGKWTVGCGHLIVPGDGCVPGDIITEAQVVGLLERDVASAVACVNRSVTKSINQNQFDALVIFTFNVGQWAFMNSTLLKKINVGDFVGASKEFLRWDLVGGNPNVGLLNRRLQEQKLFNQPVVLPLQQKSASPQDLQQTNA